MAQLSMNIPAKTGLIKTALAKTVAARGQPRAQGMVADLRDDVTSPMIAGGIGFAVLLVTLVLWANFTMIAGAVIAHGQTVVHGKPKMVQTLDGGEVAEISVKDGDKVAAGQVMLRLDPTVAQVNLNIANTRLTEALTRRARLTAEQLGLSEPDFNFSDLPIAVKVSAQQEEGQRQIFAARAAVLQGRRDKLTETQGQVEAQMAGTEGRIAAVQHQITLIEKDIANIQSLVDQGLAKESQLTALQSQQADFTGQLAQLQGEQNRARAQLRDAEIETLQSERSFMEDVVVELREVTNTVEELTLDIVSRQAQLKRTDIRAPVDGIVHQLQFSTVGGVVGPGATILEVVPLDQGVDFEIRLDPRYVDQVHAGQKARLVLSAFSRATTPDLHGEVVTVTPDAIADPVTGAHYYGVKISIPEEELVQVSSLDILPGMPVEAFLETGERSVMTYLLKPLTDHLSRAFRE
ncbi:MAG: HlyD family type I secretion periplasmic adaptor subunit [Albidovulum sp.]